MDATELDRLLSLRLRSLLVARLLSLVARFLPSLLPWLKLLPTLRPISGSAPRRGAGTGNCGGDYMQTSFSRKGLAERCQTATVKGPLWFGRKNGRRTWILARIAAAMRTLIVFSYCLVLMAFFSDRSARAAIAYPASPASAESVLIYDSTAGSLELAYPEVSRFGFNLFELRSATSSFLTATASKPQYFNEHAANVFRPDHLFYVALGDAPQVRSFKLDGILPNGLTGAFLARDLSFASSCTADKCAAFAGLRVVPEPDSTLAFLVAIGLICGRRKPRSIRRRSNERANPSSHRDDDPYSSL